MDNITNLFGTILDVGAALIQSGAETHRVEDSLYRLSEAYGFTECHIWVIPSNIQASVITPEGEELTQIRYVRHPGIDFTRLDRLNALSRRACDTHMDVQTLRKELLEIQNYPEPKAWLHYLAGAMAGGGFGIFFGCDWMDALAAVLASLLVTFLCRRLGPYEGNPLISNFVVSLVSESFILLLVQIGIGHHVGYITVGVVMLLISALGVTNGLRDLLHLDTLSGVMFISQSLIGAIGIALGIALPLLLFSNRGASEIMVLHPNRWIELAVCTIGCVGFSLWFRVHPKHIFLCAFGAFFTWAVYLATSEVSPNAFLAIMAGAAACALLAQIMARVKKAPATIFQTIAVFPLIPGAALYYTMYGLVLGDMPLALSKGKDLGITCFGIVLGFMLAEVIGRIIWKTAQNK